LRVNQYFGSSENIKKSLSPKKEKKAVEKIIENFAENSICMI
jgi:hypothetical protein